MAGTAVWTCVTLGNKNHSRIDFKCESQDTLRHLENSTLISSLLRGSVCRQWIAVSDKHCGGYQKSHLVQADGSVGKHLLYKSRDWVMDSQHPCSTGRMGFSGNSRAWNSEAGAQVVYRQALGSMRHLASKKKQLRTTPGAILRPPCLFVYTCI